MDINQKIKISLKEADLYHNQGLLNEADAKYREALEFIKKHLPLENAGKIKKAIEKKILDLEKERTRVEKKVLSPQMTRASQDLITQMFVSADSQDHVGAKMEGTKALIKFGQFDRALEELIQLIKEPSLKTEAAKQMMTCYILDSKVDEAIDLLERWISTEFFPDDQMESIRKHSRELLKTRGIDIELPDIKHHEQEKTKIPIENIGTKDSLANKKDSFFFEEDFEEFDILASAKKPAKKQK
jgi:tetratricopeptide (TPR) repeat protein